MGCVSQVSPTAPSPALGNPAPNIAIASVPSLGVQGHVGSAPSVWVVENAHTVNTMSPKADKLRSVFMVTSLVNFDR